VFALGWLKRAVLVNLWDGGVLKLELWFEDGISMGFKRVIFKSVLNASRIVFVAK
jgi:hypothetical protein